LPVAGCEGWSYHDTSPDSIEFWVDKDEALHRIRFFGRKDKYYSVSVKIQDSQSMETLLFVEDGVSSVPLPYKDRKIDVFDVMFPPYALRNNNHYVVEAFIDGPRSCFGLGGVHSVKCHDVTFNFKNYFTSKKAFDFTNVKKGQFAEFFFRPVCK